MHVALPPQLLSDLLARPQDVAELVVYGEVWTRIRRPKPGLGVHVYFNRHQPPRWQRRPLHSLSQECSALVIRASWLGVPGKHPEARWVRLPAERCEQLGGGHWFGCDGGDR